MTWDYRWEMRDPAEILDRLRAKRAQEEKLRQQAIPGKRRKRARQLKRAKGG